MLVEFIIYTVIIASVAAWVLAIAYKWGIIEKLQANAPCELIHKLASCLFCLSWWTCVALSVVASVILWDWHMLLIPFVATRITQCLIR